jgi:hypothetical protein
MEHEPIIRDNGGKTCDRYLVIINKHVFHMSSDASSPNGYNMYTGLVEEYPDLHKNGGVLVDFSDLNDSVQRAIKNRIKQIEFED